jgi:Flp pilus assembly protein TadD
LQAEQSLTTYLSLAKPRLDAADPKDNTDSLERGMTQAYLALAQLAEQRQDMAAAEQWMSQITRPQDLLAVQLRRASMLAAKGHLEEGLALIQSVPENTPDEARSKLFAQVQLLRDNDQVQRAYDLLGQASTDNPEDMDLVYEQAMLAEKLKNYAQMETLLRAVMAQQPNNQSAFNALGYSLAERGIRLDEARTLVQKALALAPNDPFIVDSLGWVEFKSGHLEQAAKLLNQAFQQKEDPEIAAHLGEVLWQQGQQAQARAIWQRGLVLSPKNEALLSTMTRLGVKP